MNSRIPLREGKEKSGGVNLPPTTQKPSIPPPPQKPPWRAGQRDDEPLKEGIVVKGGTNNPPTTPPPQEPKGQGKPLGAAVPVGPYGLPPDRTTLTPYEMGWNAAFDVFVSKNLFPAGAVIPKVLNAKNPFTPPHPNFYEWDRGKVDYFLECFLLDQFSKRHPF